MVYEVLRNKWVQAVGLLGAIIGISIVLFLLSAVLVPLFFAFIVAYVFDPVIDKIETYKISRVGAIVTLVSSIVLLSILLPLMVLPGVLDQAREMMKPAPVVRAQESASVDGGGEAGDDVPFPERFAKKLEDMLGLDSLVVMAGWSVPENQDPDALAIIRKHIGQFVNDNVEKVLESLAPQFKAAGMSAVKVASIVGDTLLRVFLFIGNFVLFAFVAIYLLKDYDDIVAAGDRLVPPRFQPKVREIMGRIDRQLRSFLRGQFTVSCCLGSMYAIGFLISGVPFAILLALFGALASFVPYLGLILTIGPAVILTVLVQGIDWHILGVLITFAVAQFLEGNFLTPKIVGSQVGLGPVWVILAIMVFSSTLGFIGLLLAVPIAAVLKVLAEEGLDLYRNSRFFSGDDASALP